MGYDVNNLKNNRGGATLETSDKAPTPAGLYRHPETGAEIITLFDPLFGDAQSEGVVRLGFERVGDAPEGSVKSIVEVILDEKQKDNTVTGIAARLEKLEGVAENNKALEAENADLKKQLEALNAKDTETRQSGELAKAEAEKQTEARGPENAPAVDGGNGVNGGEAPAAPAQDVEESDPAKDGDDAGSDEPANDPASLPAANTNDNDKEENK